MSDQQGLPARRALRPAVAATECCLAFVELASTGIVAVEMDHGSRVKSLYEVEGRLSAVEADEQYGGASRLDDRDRRRQSR